MYGSRGGAGGPDSPPPPPEKSQKYRAYLEILVRILKNNKATKPAFNVGPSSRQRNAI